MPAVKKPTKQPAPKQPDSIKPDLLNLGRAVALANLAEVQGMHVRDVLTLPDRLREAGLPEKPEHWVARLAHDILRDRTDALLFRIKATPMSKVSLTTGTDGPTMAEAVIVQQKQEAQRTKAAERRDEARTEVLRPAERKALVEKIKSAPPRPSSSGGLLGRAT